MQQKITLKYKKLTPDAKAPTKAHEGDLWDIYANEDIDITSTPQLVSTGLAFDIPEGYQLRVYNRSGNALKGILLSNGVGVIDTGYKGELKGLFHKVTKMCMGTQWTIGCVVDTKGNKTMDTVFPIYAPHTPYTIHKGDKIMQIELVRLNDFALEEVKELSESDRGTDGFGSTDRFTFEEPPHTAIAELQAWVEAVRSAAEAKILEANKKSTGE